MRLVIDDFAELHQVAADDVADRSADGFARVHQDSSGGGKATRKTMARALTRGPDYRAQFTLEHDVKRRKLLKKRQDAERAAEAAAKAAKKGTK